MNMKELEEKFKNMHLLDRDERTALTRELEVLKPEFMKSFAPSWWLLTPCVVNVLIVCDGNLNFGVTEQFGLSEFLTTFNKLEAISRVQIKYKVTLAHREMITNNPNPVVVKHISNFNFVTSVNLKEFDQVWLFAFDNVGSINQNEINAIESYMNGGGGLFATGDHGLIGKTMCGKIPRVKDMRYWDYTPAGTDTNTSEVGMVGKRRNDTNMPRPGNLFASDFNHQSDSFPQKIKPILFDDGSPHPLLSISSVVRPSGVIDIMPDHPHEGECTPRTSFIINGIKVWTQIVARSFVTGGNRAVGKVQTEPHSFPSISVFDGRLANVGRIVIDSTWHHFVNINLNGIDTGETGLTAEDFRVIRRYYMNIALWMTRKKTMTCVNKAVLFDLLKNAQLIEATLFDPSQKLDEISLADLNSIGALAEEILSNKYSPAFAKNFSLELLEDYNPEFADTVNPWNSEARDSDRNLQAYHQNWLNLDLILRTAIGAGFVALRDNKELNSNKAPAKSLDKIKDVFTTGIDFGFNVAVRNMNSNLNGVTKTLIQRDK